MPNTHSYTIRLDLTQSTQSKQAIAELNRAFEDGQGSIDGLNDAFVQLAEQVDDVAELERQYNRNIAKTLSAKDHEIEQLIKQQALIEDINSEEYKALNAKIKAAEQAKASIKADAAHYKALVREAQLKRKFKAFFDVKAGANAIKAQIGEYGRLIKTLKTVEGRYAAIDKIKAKANAVAKVAGKVGSIGLKAVGGAVGVASIAAGAVMGSASNQAAKENALKALKGADESVVDQVFVQTGADYSTIVAAINKLSDRFNGDELVAAATQEVKTPGFGDLLMASNKVGVSASKLASVIDQIKKSSGSQDLSAAMAASTKARSVTRGSVSQANYVQAYAALQGAGVDEDRINRIISSIAAKGGDFVEQFNKADLTQYVRGQQKNQIAGLQLSKLDPDKEAEKSPAERLQESINRVQLTKDRLMAKLMPKVAEIADKVLGSPAFDKLITGLGRFIDQLMPVLDHALNALMPVIESLLPPILRLMEPLIGLIEPVMQALTPVISWAAQVLAPVIDTLASFIDFMLSGKVIESIKGAFVDLWEHTIKPAINRVIHVVLDPLFGLVNSIIDAINNIEIFGDKLLSDPIGRVEVPQLAQGGIAKVPSICGEAGPEMVLPLNNPTRAANIINNYNTNQNFNLTGAQTPLSLSQAVNNNRFIRHVSAF